MIIPSQFANILQAPARAALDCYERWDALRELDRLARRQNIAFDSLAEIDLNSLCTALEAVGISPRLDDPHMRVAEIYQAMCRFASAARVPDSIGGGDMDGALVSALILWVRDGRTIADLYAENA